MATVKEVFTKAGGDLDARVILEHVMGFKSMQLPLHLDDEVSDSQTTRFFELMEERRGGKPVAHMVGFKEFMSTRFEVNPNVLVPRPETEFLVEEAIQFLEKRDSVQVLDIGTGSGCIAISVAKQLEGEKALHVIGIDISAEALKTARDNARNLGVNNVNFVHVDMMQLSESDKISLINQGDIRQEKCRKNIEKENYGNIIPNMICKGKADGLADMSKVPKDTQFDAILSNPPYIPTADIDGLMCDVRDFEPHTALDGGADGLDYVRKIVDLAVGAKSESATIDENIKIAENAMDNVDYHGTADLPNAKTVETMEQRGYLKVGGMLALEIGHDQAKETLAIMRGALSMGETTDVSNGELLAGSHFETYTIKDLAGIERIVVGIRLR